MRPKIVKNKKKGTNTASKKITPQSEKKKLTI
jgi:hypothetical protein